MDKRLEWGKEKSLVERIKRDHPHILEIAVYEQLGFPRVYATVASVKNGFSATLEFAHGYRGVEFARSQDQTGVAEAKAVAENMLEVFINADSDRKRIEAIEAMEFEAQGKKL